MNFESIPQYVKDNADFCCWRYEQRNGRRTKVPYDPRTGRRAKTNVPDTFTDFVTAAGSDGYDGIGIRISGRIVGIDLDHCVADSQLLPWAEEIEEYFKGAYIEYSPSGTGLRILCLMQKGYVFDKTAYYIKRDGVEVYVPGATDRFVTLTGNVCRAGECIECQDALEWLLDTYMKRKLTTKSVALPEPHSYLSDEGVVEMLTNARNGAKFQKLWSGDISGNTSHSEADAALCSMLSFGCGGDTAQMDRLFRKSDLMREKWDEQRGADTYGELTIKNAVLNATAFYSPIQSSSAAEDFDDRLVRITALKPEDASNYSWTDIGAGRLLADLCKDTLRYVPERKAWFCYEDGTWMQDVGGLQAMKRCMDLADDLYRYALHITDEHTRKGYIDYIRKWQSHGYRVNILKDAQVHHPVSMRTFDADPYVFNCANGTLHTETGAFREHRSEDMLTKCASVRYDPEARFPRWEQFIQEVMSGDAERARFLQMILGHGLTGDTRHEVMTILYGSSTRNGKGTLCESVLKVLGPYGCTARPETLAFRNNANGSQPSEEIARLAGVRFVNIPEPGKGLLLNAALVKSLTGNDTVNARFLHENSFDFRPQFKLYINTNYLPAINDMTVFTSGRVVIIPFDRHFDESEQDRNLKHEFALPEAQSAILNWLANGYKMLRSDGLVIPASVKSATEQYRHDSDKTALFVEECMEPCADAEERTADVYDCYRYWCAENRVYAESMKNFRQSLSAVMEVRRKRPISGGEKTTVVTGYRLVSEFLQ